MITGTLTPAGVAGRIRSTAIRSRLPSWSLSNGARTKTDSWIASA